jgi:hypothetical protein
LVKRRAEKMRQTRENEENTEKEWVRRS